MSTTLKAGWLKDSQGNKFAPKTMSSQVMKDDGVLLEDYIDLGLTEVKGSLNNKADTIHEHDDKYYTETEIDNMVFITTDEIDSIAMASPEALFVSSTQENYDALVESGEVDEDKYYVIEGDIE